MAGDSVVMDSYSEENHDVDAYSDSTDNVGEFCETDNDGATDEDYQAEVENDDDNEVASEKEIKIKEQFPDARMLEGAPTGGRLAKRGRKSFWADPVHEATDMTYFDCLHKSITKLDKNPLLAVYKSTSSNVITTEVFPEFQNLVVAHGGNKDKFSKEQVIRKIRDFKCRVKKEEHDKALKHATPSHQVSPPTGKRSMLDGCEQSSKRQKIGPINQGLRADANSVMTSCNRVLQQPVSGKLPGANANDMLYRTVTSSEGYIVVIVFLAMCKSANDTFYNWLFATLQSEVLGHYAKELAEKRQQVEKSLATAVDELEANIAASQRLLSTLRSPSDSYNAAGIIEISNAAVAACQGVVSKGVKFKSLGDSIEAVKKLEAECDAIVVARIRELRRPTLWEEMFNCALPASMATNRTELAHGMQPLLHMAVASETLDRVFQVASDLCNDGTSTAQQLLNRICVSIVQSNAKDIACYVLKSCISCLGMFDAGHREILQLLISYLASLQHVLLQK